MKACAADRGTRRRSSSKEWDYRLHCTGSHIGHAPCLFLPEPQQVWELSKRTALVGMSRRRMAGPGRPVPRLRLFPGRCCQTLLQIFVPNLFAAIHSVMQDSSLDFCRACRHLQLGCFYAWAVRSGGGSLKRSCVVRLRTSAAAWLRRAR